MLTTQIQVLLYIGNIQVISCSVFVPVPSIVVKSHQTLEAILPYLPNSNNNATTMASLEYPQQTSTTVTAAAAVGGTVTVKFAYPVPSTNSSTATPELVQVTGTFNAWQRSQPLTCNQDKTFFEADIPIDLASLSHETDNKKQEDPNRKKILFKFVLDGQSWVTDPDQEAERDYAGNLNNVLFITNPVATAISTTVDTKDDAPKPPVPAVAAAENKTETTETEEEKAARLKQEAEDDLTIRQLGGGMWGAPYFAVNDPADLPEHYLAAAEGSETKEVEVTLAPATPAAPAAATPLTTTIIEKEKEAEETVAEKIDAPAPAAVEPVVQVAQITVESSPAPEQPKEDEVEDEDDKIIKALGGGMWGTPFFKVNDPTAFPEHFQEALGANAAAASISASSPSPAVETEEVTDRDGDNIHIVKDEITTTVEGGKLIETVVETTEDTIIEAADGTFLEESITTSVEDTISGVIDEEVTEIIETIEEEEAPSFNAAVEVQGTQVVVEDEGAIEFVETILEQTDDDDTNIIPNAGTLTPPEVTMTETEMTTSVQGEDGVETTIVEDTMTFSEGPEVDADSLHSLTTGVKPVTEGESVVVEQSPEFVVAASTPSSGDAKPSVDESIEPLSLPSLSSTTVNTTDTAATPSTVEPLTPILASNNNNKDSQDAESAVVLLPQAGDAKPTADLSVATAVLTPTPIVEIKSTLPDHLVPGAEPASLTTTVSASTEKGGQITEKSEKRKSFWKKVKKVLS
ncbi:hypothetical protein KI688_006755 [Linnemannia hyalina]|uniref:AMP-activated protein kinase glycogen-binding domain-containing protein n=1 Tax=Linnemannia hyalina TaxID=64524 RepID=A0A9P8BNE3_9FUNG|nr:hypothetical protein KI688_006755 [Linnemannia hyalina]